MFDTNSGGREGLPLGVLVPTPPTAPLGVPGAAGDFVVLAPLTALLGVPSVVVGVLLTVVAPVGEHFEATGIPTHVPGGGVQFVVVVLVHGGGVQFVVVVLVHGGGVVLVTQPV